LGLAIVGDLLTRDEDADDLQVPLLVWWAIEMHCDAGREAVLALFSDASLWSRRMVSAHILPRLMQRFASTGRRQDLVICARLLTMSPDKESPARLMHGFEEAFKGRPVANLPDELARALERTGSPSTALALRLGKPDAVEPALKSIADAKTPSRERVQLIEAL